MANTSTVARDGGSSLAPARGRHNGKPPSKPSGLPNWVVPYALLLPGLLVIAGLLLYPLYQMVGMSFQNVGLRQIRGAPAESVGFENYQKLVESELFWTSLRNTVVFAVVTVALTLTLGTLVGLLLHKLGKKMSTFLIVGIMAAWATPQIATAIIWRWLFDAESGVINWALNALPDWFSSLLFGRSDWTGEPWLNDALTIYMVLIVAVVWASFPFIAVSVLAGLKSISRAVRGGPRGRRLRVAHLLADHLPAAEAGLRGADVLSIIWDFKVFTQLFVLAGGTSNREAFNLSLYAYTQAFSVAAQDGLGAAIAVVLT